MRKSQIITLIILFIAVSLFIWIGACSDRENDPPDPDATIRITSPGTETATPGPAEETPEVPETTPTPDPTITKPEVDFTQVDGLRTAELALDVSFTDYVFTDETTKSVMDQSTYILSNPGTDSQDIYMSFLLHYSETNDRVTELLDLAKERNVKFTFFLSSMYLNDDENLALIKRMHDEGHTIGTRGDKSIDQLSVSSNALYDSLWAMETKYQSIFGTDERMYFYAPDQVSERNMKLANLMGYTVTFKLCNFVTNAGSQPQTYNGVVFQSSNITDDLIDQVTGYVDWGLSQGYTFKGFTK